MREHRKGHAIAPETARSGFELLDIVEFAQPGADRAPQRARTVSVNEAHLANTAAEQPLQVRVGAVERLVYAEPA